MRRLLLCLLATGCTHTGCNKTSQSTSSTDFDETFEGLREKYGLSALNVGRIYDGELIRVGAYGIADQRSGTPARPDTLYSLASVSKVFVGLAAARAIDLGFELDLDADVNDYLGWSTPLEHPDFPDTPVTFRQLARHRSSIEADGPEDYETYPKPDPMGTLDAFLQGRLADETYWTEAEPGTDEEYSNYGTALAALVVEKVVGQRFEEFCNTQVFGPLGMNDTRWFYHELSESQRARLARPQGEEGPYEHYGFGDWPSGQLRSTVGDLARAMLALSGDGDFLGSAGRAAFEGTPLFVEVEGNKFSHSGGEVGVNTYIEYTREGDGLIILTNQDLEDDDLEAMMTEVETALNRVEE